MAKIDVQGFAGRIPVRDVLHLANHNAVVAENCRIYGGKIFGMRSPEVVQADTVTGTLLSIFPYNADWFEWTLDVDAHKAQVDDAHDRIIWTGDTEPRVTYNAIATGGPGPYPDSWYTLGVPAPATGCTAVLSGVADDAESVAESRFYVITYVDIFGAEGPPSPISNEVEWRQGQTVNLNSIPGAPVGNYNITNKRIYRTNTGSTGTAYQLVAEIAIGPTTANDAVSSVNLGEIIETANYDQPNASMIGLTALPNGYFAGFYGNTLCLSVPGQPHAWPIEYRLNTAYDIVGLSVLGTSIIVMTEGSPYVASGVHPASTTLEELDVHQGCVSKRSIVSFGDYVLYASPDGLVGINGGGAKLLTEGLFLPEDWRNVFNNSNDFTVVNAANWEGLYLYTRSDSTGVNFVISPGAGPELGLVTYTTVADAFHYDKESDLLYIGENGNISIWNGESGASDLTYTWRSKDFYTDSPVNFCWARVVANSYPVTLDVYGDDTLLHSTLVQDDSPFRLPGDNKYTRHKFEFSSTDPDREVVRVVMAETTREIR
jgi:hypothetical protein